MIFCCAPIRGISEICIDTIKVTSRLLRTAQEVAASTIRERIILLVGGPRSGKTTVLRAAVMGLGWPIVNLNLALSERLLTIPMSQRSVRVEDLMHKIAATYPSDGLAIDNIELLFQRDLETNAEAILRSLARQRPILASWPGTFDGSTLTYAAPTHTEYERWPRPEVRIVTLLGLNT